MKIKPAYLVLVSLLGLVSCGSSSTAPKLDQVSLVVDRERYATGQEIVARLVNDDTRTISFSWCDIGLQRQEIEGWAAVALAPVSCQLTLNVLEPGDESSYTLPQDSPLSPATYRLMLEVRPEDFEELTTIVSSPFDVTPE